MQKNIFRRPIYSVLFKKAATVLAIEWVIGYRRARDKRLQLDSRHYIVKMLVGSGCGSEFALVLDIGSGSTLELKAVSAFKSSHKFPMAESGSTFK
jgi:hypothetical protein